MASKHKIEFDNFNAKKYFKPINYTEKNIKTKKLTIPTIWQPIKNTSNMDYCVKKNEIIQTTDLIKDELMNCFGDTSESFYRMPCRADCMKLCCNFEENEIISTTDLIKDELMNCFEDNSESFYRMPCRSDCMKSCCNFEEDEYVYKNNPIIKMDES